VTSPQEDANRLREGLLLDELRLGGSAKDQRRLLLNLYPVASDRSVPLVREFLLSDHDGVRVAAIHTLSAVGTEAAVSALAGSLEQQTNLGITFTARELRKLSARSAIPALANCLQERKDELDTGPKLLVIGALTAMPHRSEVPALGAVLDDSNRRVRRAAARALERLDMPEADAALQDAARQLSWLTGRPARRALNRRYQAGT
jgi:HEAT repeat protein